MITDIRLQNFRSYKDESFELGLGVNIIVGPNTSGKTNLLEAIQILCNGSSYRAKDNQLVRYKKPWARLDAHTKNGQRTVKLERSGDGVKKSFEIDKQIFVRLGFVKTLPVVLFEPNDLQLFHGSPELRRNFMDDLLEQTIPDFGQVRRQYRRVLTQRNSLLKRAQNTTQQQLFVWDVRLSDLGGRIATYRQQLVQNLNEKMSELYSTIANSKTQIEVNYDSACSVDNYSTSLLKKLEASTNLDFVRGFTSHGPHRDDFKILLNNHPAEDSASRGETRTLLLALKIVELSLIEVARNKKPILLLDDVFSELDGKRRRSLTEFLDSYQTFITTTDADVVVQHFLNNCTIIPTNN
ncbi:DNA replication/repair protein RecF [Candidatus Saccharibacteria bacterium]|nr:DNA replication/repair protein RecF [Candidatus Saccharibacteria bacterium]MBI3337920.1 DNA replication/repair protein RecF [Candidatus Saccharibacteria bacterium]